MIRAARTAPLLAAIALLGACATTAPPPHTDTGGPISGRIAVNVAADGTQPARSLSAAFELRGNDQIGALELSTPLGTILAQAAWRPGTATLTTAQGERRFADLDALSRELLGETVPVAAMFDWLRGRPWAGAPSMPQGERGFAQLGWHVDLTRFADASVAARRETLPVVTVRAALDRQP